MVGRSGVRRRLKILFPALLILCSANFILFHRSTGCGYLFNFYRRQDGLQLPKVRWWSGHQIMNKRRIPLRDLRRSLD